MKPKKDDRMETDKLDRAPVRTCIACGLKTEVSMLLRVVRRSNGDIAPDPKRRLSGRGAHVCKNASCLNKAIEKRLFNRAFRAEIARQSTVALVAHFGASGPSTLMIDVNRALI